MPVQPMVVAPELGGVTDGQLQLGAVIGSVLVQPAVEKTVTNRLESAGIALTKNPLGVIITVPYGLARLSALLMILAE